MSHTQGQEVKRLTLLISMLLHNGCVCFNNICQGCYVFGPVSQLVNVFVCLWTGLRKNSDFNETRWKGEAWAKDEPFTFWSGSESQGGYTEYISNSFNIAKTGHGLGGGLCFLSALLV